MRCRLARLAHAPSLGDITFFDGKPATADNSTIVALAVDACGTVDALHAKVLSLDAADERAPGARGGGLHAAYFRAMDRNKVKMLCIGKACLDIDASSRQTTAQLSQLSEACARSVL